MRVVQMAGDEVVDMVSVRHCFVTATGAMLMGRVMGTTSVGRRAMSRVCRVDRDRVLVDEVTPRVMHVTVVEVVSMPVVLHGSMAASCAMPVCVIRVRLMLGHAESPSLAVDAASTVLPRRRRDRPGRGRKLAGGAGALARLSVDALADRSGCFSRRKLRQAGGLQ
jgi:hypothetical protein